MKRFFAILLTALMLLSLVACAPAGDEKKSSDSKPSLTETEADKEKADSSEPEESKEEEKDTEASKAEEEKPEEDTTEPEEKADKEDKEADKEDKEADKADEQAKTAWDGTPAKFHIGIVTGTVSQSEDDLRGAEELIRRYGSTDEGGMITHLTYPDLFTSEQETTIAQITGLADDPDMKVIVVNQSVPGTAAAFKKIREMRDDIILLAGCSQEDPNTIHPVADVVVDCDNVSRGYLIPYAAKELGAKTFVHVSFPRHMGIELLSLRRTIMKEACKDLGIEFYDETAPDPTSDAGQAGAQMFVLENMEGWVKKYGKDTSFFCTNDAHTEPLLKKVAELGAIFNEADLPSPLMGYPGALGIDLKDVAGDWPAILKRVEEAVVKAGGKDRMATWAYSFGFTTSAGLGEYGRRIVEGEAELGNMEDLLKVYREFCPGADWKGSNYIDQQTDKPFDHYFLVYQDEYVFGKGYLGLTDVEVPEKYYHIKNQQMEPEEGKE